MQPTTQIAAGGVCLALAAILAAPAGGCGGSQKKSKSEQEAAASVDRKAECDAGDMGACVVLGREACVDKAWALEYADSPAVYVSASGLVRVDRHDMLMFSTNTEEWLSCMKSCPGTDAENVCIPFGHDMEFGTQQGENCERSERDSHPWNGHEAKTLQLDCQDGTWEITYVPEYLDVHKALIAAGIIDPGDLLATAEGLVVEASFSGYPLLSLASISKANCSLFALPQGYSVVAGKTAFEDLRKVQPELETKLQGALVALRAREDDPARMARKHLEPQLESICEKAGLPFETEADLDACIEKNIAARALVAKVTARALDSFAHKAAPRAQEVLREEYVTPLCQRFAK